jgi:hypothetical protein
MTRRTSPRPRSRLAARLAVLLAATATFSVSLLSTSALLPRSAAAALTTAVASADAKVQADMPDTNYGTTTSLAARGPAAASPQQRSYIKITVSGLSGPPASARLDIYSNAVSTTGVQVSSAGNGWTETGITWNNAPAVGPALATVSPLTANTTAGADVSSVVTGNGTYTFVVTTTSTTGKTFASREVAAHPPTLVLDTSPVAAASAPGTTTPATTTPATTTGTAAGTTVSSATTTTGGTITGGTITGGTTTGATTGTAPVSTMGAATPASATATTFAPSADGYVEADTPTTAYGASYQLNTQAPGSSTPEERAYLTFPVKGLTGTVTSATLALYTYSTWANGITVSSAVTGWTESNLTWSTAPAVGAVAGTAKNLVNGTTVSVDVTRAVAGNGTIGFVVTTDRTTGLVKFASREASANKPQLVVQTTTGTTTTSTTSASSTTSSTTPASDPTIVAAGDIACPDGKAVTTTSCQQTATGDLAISLNPTAVLPLGDDQYELGALSDFRIGYDPSWGRLNPIAHPVPGNHEYGYIGTSIQPTGGEGYFTYFGDRGHPLSPGCTKLCTSWYSWNISGWHMIALDSQCAVVGGCNPGSPQYQWLVNDLNANTSTCTLAYWHIPIYSSSTDHQPDMQAIYQLLYTKKADVVLNGHAHFYERFAPQDGSGNAQLDGIPEFIVGTGGRSFFAMRPTPSANSVAQIANTFGVLQMTLSNGTYSWRFVPSNAGGSTDSGSGTCH